MKTWTVFLGSLALVVLLSATVLGEVPTTMHVQGRLTDDTGVPVEQNFAATFKIFDAPVAGNEVWPHVVGQETFAVTTDSLGLWNAVIGESYPIAAEIFGDTSLWLQIIFDDHVTHPATFPRVKLHSGPFTFRAAWSQAADSAFAVRRNTITSAQIVEGSISFSDIGQNGAVAGDVIKWSGTRWAAEPDEGGSGEYVQKSGDVMTGDLEFDPDGNGSVMRLHPDPSGPSTFAMTDSDSSHVEMTTRGTYSHKPELRLRDSSGAEALLFIRDGAGRVYLTDSLTSSGKVSLSAHIASAGGSRLVLWDSSQTASIVMAPGLPGDYAVEFPEGAISGEEIADGTVALADLAQGGAASGEVIKWNGSEWETAPDETAAGDYVLKTGDVMTGNLTLQGSSPENDVVLKSTGTTQHGEVIIYNGLSNSIYLDAANSSGHPDLALTYDGDRRASLGSSDLGAYLYLYDSSKTTTITISAFNDLVNGAWLRLTDTSETYRIALAPGASSANDRAFFPNDAIARDEIWDEPGVTQNIDSAGSVSLTGTGQNIMTNGITCPRSGYVMATATFELDITHLNGTATEIDLGLSDTPGVLAAEQARSVYYPVGMPTGGYAEIISIQRIFSVPSSGLVSYYLVGSRISAASNPIITKMTLNLVYLPTSYGVFEE